MMPRFYNTLTRRKDDFTPIDANNVRLYGCGPTVYDRLHIGNGRMLIVFDVLFRVLRHVYGADHVTYVRNITDVDDKINARAAERRVPIKVLTDEMTVFFHEDAAALGCLPPTIEPRATDHIAEMIVIMQRLIANGHAYAAEGHVLFDVPSMPDYGRLANRSVDEMLAGARIEVAPYKLSPTDFVLWKPSSSDEPGWESPWGRGRPGWHLECSAMSWKHLGETFDIHGGGIDLVFPHHENEVAQSRCAFGHDHMANVWMHNGHLQVEGEKMSKSVGNFVTIHDLWASSAFGQQLWPGDVLRLAMLKTHYRDPVDWTVKRLSEAQKEFLLWAEIIAEEFPTGISDFSIYSDESGFLEALYDDLNTPLAITNLHRIYKTALLDRSLVGVLAKSLNLLGFVNISKPGFFYDSLSANIFESGPQIDLNTSSQIFLWRNLLASGDKTQAALIHEMITARGFHLTINDAGVVLVGNVTSAEFEKKVAALLDKRKDARAAKDWAASDRIRDELAAMGVAVKDNKDGTVSWETKR